MGETANPAVSGASSVGGLRSRLWQRFLSGPDQSLLEELYIPALSEAVSYDRCCAYFSSSVLAAAARGFAGMIERFLDMGEAAPRPGIRLLVNEELPAEDVKALIETGDTSELEALLRRRLRLPRDILQRRRFEMLGWMVKEKFLDVRVGVMRFGDGILHAKFGIATDGHGDAVVFNGSGNESASGLLANYERLEVSTSWEDPDRYRVYREEFERLWNDTHPDVHTVSLPEALERRLIKFAPKAPPTFEPSNALVRQRAAMIWRFITEAPYLPEGAATCDATTMVDLWPHQRRVVEETSAAWPAGRLLCDEVGMGKTVEAILILRRLMAGRGVKRALILLPAGLLEQWQGELREKGGLIFPRLEGNRLIWPDRTEQKVNGFAEALEQDMILVSRETARSEGNLALLLAAKPWDLVVMDEAHAARRSQQDEGEYNGATLLLNLLRKLQLSGQARSMLLMSATPMQTHPWEPWDLLAILGEGNAWLADFGNVRAYYDAVAQLGTGACDRDTALKAAELIAADSNFPPFSDGGLDFSNAQIVRDSLAFPLPAKRDALRNWLRAGSPLARRMHRNTRRTLRRYYELGLLSGPLPERKVTDVVIEYRDSAERNVYESVARYIDRRYEQLEREKTGKGFVMTIYRRRAASSPLALQRSLERRRHALRQIVERRVYDHELARRDIPERLDPLEMPDGDEQTWLSASLPREAREALAELAEVEKVLEGITGLRGRDRKLIGFFEELRQITSDGRPALVFTEYTDTLEYLRDRLVTDYGTTVACYSGDGGQLWDGQTWIKVTKDVVSERLRSGNLRVLICTDAASEGLNLQAAGALINYDLPWNPSKVEQRIGRIDRIGQKFTEVRVVNLLIRDTVDEEVYRALRRRCGLFERFVGSMQPVLERASRMLLGRERFNINAIDETLRAVQRDTLSEETYVESHAQALPPSIPAVGREDLIAALEYLKEELGFRVDADDSLGRYVVYGPERMKLAMGVKVEALERDASLKPLTPMEPELKSLVQALSRSGERLPLVLGSCQRNSFRASVAFWTDGRERIPVASLKQLKDLVECWDGVFPNPAKWQEAEQVARIEAEKLVTSLEERAANIQSEGLTNQLSAARLRLMREVGKYLISSGADPGDLNNPWYRQMSREISGATRLKQAQAKIGGYPEWPSALMHELEDFARLASDNERRGLLMGSQLDAALADPRWNVTQYPADGAFAA
jgi:superfamily II DNA or RNA helicase